MQPTLLLVISLFLFFAYFFGSMLEKLKQPKVIAETMVGLVLGPTLFGHFFPEHFNSLFSTANQQSLTTLKELGLLMLMFCSGNEIKSLEHKKHLKPSLLTIFFGIGIPALFSLMILDKIDLNAFHGTSPSHEKLVIILTLSAAVTSIPVISRIFIELNLIESQFAKMILSSAILEDLILYATLNATIMMHQDGSEIWTTIAKHILITALFLMVVVFGKNKIYEFARKFAFRKPNLELYQYVTLIFATLLICVFTLSQFGITSMITAFACGIISASATSDKARETSEVIKRFSFATFIPIYFIMVGFKINLFQDLTLQWLAGFLILSSLFKILGGFLAGKFSGFSNLKSAITGITLNARGGPGIVIASTALEAGIINTSLFTTLVLTALLTSSAAGMTLRNYRSKIVKF